MVHYSSLLARRGKFFFANYDAADGDRRELAKASLVVLSALLALAASFGLMIGPAGSFGFSFLDYIGSWFGSKELPERDRLILETIRAPRVVMGALVGAALAVSGALMQGLFRNPLADPGIVGVSAGAGLGAVAVIVLGGTTLLPIAQVLGLYTLPVSAFLGALCITWILYRVATTAGQTSIAILLLGGIAIAALAGALTGILVFMADDLQLRDLTFWNLGSLAGATWTKCLSIGPIILAAIVVSPFLARGINAIALGEAAAHHIGIPVQRLKHLTVVTVAAATGSAVAVSGGIGFVGIVVPHLLRLLIGPDNRYLLPASALLGASLLLVCDAVSRTIVAPTELPIGIVTALIGTPFFLWILLRRRVTFGF